ncbi:MAG: RNA polymerase sigma factor, partial [Planctomycetota bacterium]
MNQADAILARRAASGDAAAFDQLVERHVPRLHRWLVVSGTTNHDADDVVQDACLRAWRAISTYDPRWAFTTWIFTIAHRIRLDLVARRREHVVLTMDRAQPDQSDPLPSAGIWARARELLSAD